jgi:multidrug transporter EmrE-like cation transporter
MSPRLSKKDESAKSRLQTLKQSLSVDALKSLLTKSQGNAGRERYRRAGLTASASFISKALTIVISFVSVPLTVHYLGAERYGVWLTIGSLLTWMSMTDFGIAGNALVNLLADAHGKEDRRLAGQHADVLAYSLSLCALCTIGLGIVFARWWGVGGVAFAMALSKFCTSSPIQLLKIRGILRENRAPALVVEPSLA